MIQDKVNMNNVVVSTIININNIARAGVSTSRKPVVPQDSSPSHLESFTFKNNFKRKEKLFTSWETCGTCFHWSKEVRSILKRRYKWK
jgi:hypothetical protein